MTQQWAVPNARRILCSCFDGTGTAALILSILCIPVLAYVSWEIDKRCNELTSTLFPRVQHRGDFTKDNIDDLLQFLDAIDPEQTAEDIFCAGPPCPDFSQIRGSNAPGRKGTEGQKFDLCIDFVDKLRSRTNRKFRILFESVVMDPAEQTHFDQRLKAKSIVGEAADLKVIRRPRLWWTSVNWDTTKFDLGKHNELRRARIPDAI